MSSSIPTRDNAEPASEVSFDRKTLARFIGAVRAVATSEVGPKFRLLFVALIALMFGISGLNVLNS